MTADRERIGVSWGTGMGGAHTLDASYQQVYGKGEWRVRPLTVVMGMNNAAGSNVAVRHGLRGPFANYSTACSSSAMALGEAMRTIAAGRADAMVAGGAEALLTPGMLAAWQALRTLAPADAADPAASCKPFDKRRAGLVLGEGAAAFVLEEESRARARGARIYALLTGYGNSCDAAHMSRPDRDGQIRAMHEALAEARLSPQDIGYINAHGTATAVGDVVEAEAINAVFGAARARCASARPSRCTAICSAARARSSSPWRCSRSRKACCRRPPSSSSPIRPARCAMWRAGPSASRRRAR